MTSRTKRYFIRLFVRPQVERRYDRWWLWISTNSIVSIRTASSKSTKKFCRCRVYSYFQFILLCVAGYTWKRPITFKRICMNVWIGINALLGLVSPSYAMKPSFSLRKTSAHWLPAPTDDRNPVIESRDMHESALRMIRFLYQNPDTDSYDY